MDDWRDIHKVCLIVDQLPPSHTVHRWLKSLDIKMRHQERNIVLLVDNFSGHYVQYTPRNIQVEFFELNLTAFVQPCDAGIIRCLKAHYRQEFCFRALELEEAGERDIYKINLLEAMLLAKRAWTAVTQDTISHCWNHTKIQQNLVSYTTPIEPAPTNPVSPPTPPLADPKAWDIIREFAAADMTLPQAEECLKAYLGDKYVELEWRESSKL